MSGGVREFVYQDLSVSGREPEPRISSYEAPSFSAQPADRSEAERIHTKTDAFKLDNIIVGQLGLDEREKKIQEDRIRKEIERRWERTAEKAEVAGYTKGLEEGKTEAFKAEMPRIQERLDKFDAVIQEIDKFRDKLFKVNEAFLMDLITEVAGMIVLKEVQLDRDYIKRLVINLLQHLSTKEDVKIEISESDFANVKDLREALQKEFGKLNNTTIEANPEIPAGGCKIETRFGVVDASVISQIENMKEALRS